MNLAELNPCSRFCRDYAARSQDPATGALRMRGRADRAFDAGQVLRGQRMDALTLALTAEARRRETR